MKKLFCIMLSVLMVAGLAMTGMAAPAPETNLLDAGEASPDVVYYQWEAEDDGWDCHTFQLRWRVDGNFWEWTGETRIVNRRPGCTH